MSLVTNTQNLAVTTSRKIAETFGKQHKNVLRDIESYLGMRDLILSSDLSLDFSVNIQELEGGNGRGKEYILSESACTLVIMSYTGPRAMDFKKSYIREFNRMRSYLTTRDSALADYDENREDLGDKYEFARIEGFHGILEELGL